ncbi:MAG: thiamine pyrophosphate-binding protein [Burkholderiales bacterium]|nr:thiamine pyrophosphate-binding protein [Burkholderiales bacterium]
MITKGLSGAEAVLRVLRAMGVEHIFASPGSDWAPLWEALAQSHAPGEVPEYVSSRHEETAVAMASGYAKVTGKLPAVVLHTTVGALHATMCLRAALHERMPMVVLAGESIAFGESPTVPDPGRQWLRLLADVGGPARLVESCVKWSAGLSTSLLLPHTIQRAAQLAMAVPRGPVFVSVPVERLMEAMTADPPAVAGFARAPVADPEAIDALARELSAAAHPVIVTEQLGKSVGAVERLVELAEALGAPVVEAWQPTYVNFPRAHPLYGGVAADMSAVLAEADLVFLVEAVAPWHPPSALPAPGTRVVVLGEEPLHPRLPAWAFRADLVVAGEAERSLAMLAARVRERVPPGSRSAAAARWRARHEARRAALRDEARAAGVHAPIETRWIVHELNEVLPPDAIVVDETITHRLDVVRRLDRLGPGAFLEASYGGLGVGLGTALGAKLARPERTVVTLIGDGAFHYNPVPAAFGACQEHRLPLLVVLFDNAGYLSQKTDVAKAFPGGWAVRSGKFAGTSILPRPDYAALARAYGGYGETVEAPGEVRAALVRGFDAVRRGQLALIDMVLAPVSPDPRI